MGEGHYLFDQATKDAFKNNIVWTGYKVGEKYCQFEILIGNVVLVLKNRIFVKLLVWHPILKSSSFDEK